MKIILLTGVVMVLLLNGCSTYHNNNCLNNTAYKFCEDKGFTLVEYTTETDLYSTPHFWCVDERTRRFNSYYFTIEELNKCK